MRFTVRTPWEPEPDPHQKVVKIEAKRHSSLARAAAGGQHSNPRLGPAMEAKAGYENGRDAKGAKGQGRRDSIDSTSTAEAKDAANGFGINWMNMRDAHSGKVLWKQDKGWQDMYEREILARVPRKLLECRAVSREVNFTSEQEMRDFRLEQRVLLHDRPLEKWDFRFGFVMPGSTNTWQQVIEAADEMLPAEVLDGNVVIETSFFDGPTLLSQCRVRIFYDA